MRCSRLVALCLIAMATSIVVPVGDAAAVDIPGVVYNSGTGTFYKQYTSALDWAQADQAARSLGGHLATITSSAENSFVRTNVITTTCWLGGSDAASEGTWTWVTGEAWGYTSWNGGEPNNSGGDEDYVTIRTDGLWNDLRGTTASPYVVEWSEDPNGPPTPPSNLTADVVSEQRVDLHWVDNSTRETGFEVERSVGGGGYTQIATPGVDAETYADTDLTVETSYSYRVRAVGSGGASEWTNVATLVTPSPPVANLIATAISNSTVELEWTDVATLETGFRVERGIGAPAANFSTLATLPADSSLYVDYAAAPETTYTYRVRSLGPDGSASSSPDATVTTPPGAPVYVGLSTPDGPSVLVEWYDSSQSESYFEIERRSVLPPGPWTPIATVATNIATYDDSTVQPETQYAYRVRSGNSLGTSEWTAEELIFTPPYAPTAVMAESLSTTRVRLTWADNASYELGFSIMRAPSPGGTFTTLATVARNVTVYDDTSATQEGAYLYRIAATGSAGHSAWAVANEVHTPAVLTVTSFSVKAGKTKGKKVKPARLDIAGEFDVGESAIDLAGATTFGIGGVAVAVPALARKGKGLRYDADGVRLTLVPSSTSSHVSFGLRVEGDAAEGLDPDGAVTLTYTCGGFAAESTVQLAALRFQPPKFGHVVDPPVDVVSLAASLKSGLHDGLKVKGAFYVAAGAPDVAPEVTVELGLLNFRTTAAGFSRKGDRWSFKEADRGGARNVVLDYARGTFSIALKGIDVGEFPGGNVPVTVTIGIDGVLFADTPVLANNGKSMEF